MQASSTTENAALIESLCADHLVFTPTRHLDLASTDALIVRAAAALRCGYTVMIDLDPDVSPDDLIAHGPVIREGSVSRTGVHGPVRVLAPGIVQLETAELLWIIDLNRCAMVRSDTRIDPRFVTTEQWMPIRALWANCDTVTALTANDTYLACRSVWTAAPDRC